MGFTPAEVDRTSRFWQAGHDAPVTMAKGEGLKAVDLFAAIDRGEIKALWVMGTNPAVSLPDADRVRAALGKLDLFVVSENVASNDTINAGAHVLLPAAAWGEKDGTVTNSERRISRQRRFLKLPGEAKPDWWIIKRVAERLGFGAAFAYGSAADIFREHAALSAFENNGTRDFDIGAMAGIDKGGYDALAPVQWPWRKDEAPQARFFANGGFYTASGRARFLALEPPALKARLDEAFPLWLNTGRVRDQWHTMTRTGLSARLGMHKSEPYVEVHPEDADRFGLRDGFYARIATAHGAVLLRTVVTEKQNRGSLFAPIHWNDETAGSARVGALVHGFCDPHSGQPEAKATPASIAPAERLHYGFIVTRSRIALPEGSTYAWAAIGDGYMARIATDADPATLADLLETTIAARHTGPAFPLQRIDYQDEAQRAYFAPRSSGTTISKRCASCGHSTPARPGPWWSAPGGRSRSMR